MTGRQGSARPMSRRPPLRALGDGARDECHDGGTTLDAIVNPEASSTTYHFEYGDDRLRTEVPVGGAKVSGYTQPESVSQAVSGLPRAPPTTTAWWRRAPVVPRMERIRPFRPRPRSIFRGSGPKARPKESLKVRAIVLRMTTEMSGSPTTPTAGSRSSRRRANFFAHAAQKAQGKGSSTNRRA